MIRTPLRLFVTIDFQVEGAFELKAYWRTSAFRPAAERSLHAFKNDVELLHHDNLVIDASQAIGLGIIFESVG